MNQDQLNTIQYKKGFIAALDQSGGSTPRTLSNYGINDSTYSNENEMFNLVHEMRSRLIKSPMFNKSKIIGAILFRQTMERQIDGIDTADYLWEKKRIVPFLKIDEGLADTEDGVQLMKPMTGLDSLLNLAKEKHIFGTKMRSVIHDLNSESMQKVVDQQFEYAKKIIDAGFMPIVEPEVDINAVDKIEIEKHLLELILKALGTLQNDQKIMLKLSIPEIDDLYEPLVRHPKVLRVVALSGGYSREEAIHRLSRHNGISASFSRALLEGLNVNQSEKEFNDALNDTIESIYRASIR